MCSPPTPKAPEPINPYEGMSTDPRFAAAAKELGFSNVDNEDEVRQINQYLAEEDFKVAERDPNFAPARQQLLDEGLLSEDDDKYSSWYLSKIQGRMYDNTQDEAYAESQAQQQEAADRFAALMEKQAEDARNYRPKQADLPPVMAPVVQPKPIPVAPPTPRMEIQRTPPAPELTRTDNNMAIIKQSSTARSRLRRRTRGTASLSA